MGRLTGKVAVVTGAGTGIGRATAQLYAREGAKLVVADIRQVDGDNTVRAISDSGGEAIFVLVDVGRSADVQKLIEATESHYGALHVMTANAGIVGKAHATPLVDVAEEDFRQLIDINLIGVFLCFKHAIPLIRRSGGGALTATSSIAAIRGITGLTAYSASKGGVNALVRALSLEVAPEIRVNVVMPGGTATEVGRHYSEETGGEDYVPPETGGTPEQRRHRERLGDPVELAHAHLWLASDDASYVTGQAISVDGGTGPVRPRLPTARA